uniref:Uncharacterized protein LOC105048913 n=1 Tax=Elaeis guineensis var. tenera TaxID=51953 RepID=A0A6I9RQF0_ELAGV|nr:uncharacterized protein LOC105048913 [Elaeis guineensis]
MDPIHGDSSSKHTYDEQGHSTLGHKPEIEKVTPSSSSSFSDAESFEEDVLQLGAAEPHNSFLRSTEIARTQNGKVTSTKDVGTNDNLDMFGSNHSSPLQVMERSEVPDPNGIPSPIFTRTMSTAIDWSVVSNESLFGIQVSNSSFSRDVGFMMSRSIELTNFPMDPYWSSAAGAANAATMQGAMRVNAEKVGSKDKHAAEVMHHSASISDHFDSRMARFQSFAFTVLTDGGSGSVKVGPVNQPRPREQAQQPPPRTKTPKAAPAGNWLSCFTCSFCS